MDDTAEGKSIRFLADQFKLAAQAPLFHQQVYNEAHEGMVWQLHDAERAVEKSEAEPPLDGSWQEWHGPCKAPSSSSDPWYSGPDGEWFGRFTGDPDAIHEFRRLSNAAMVVLQRLGKCHHIGADGWEGFLELIYLEAVEHPTPLLPVESRCWYWTDGGFCDEPYSLRQIADSSQVPASPVHEHPPQPCVRTLTMNVFEAASTLLSLILEPDLRGLLKSEDFPGEAKLAGYYRDKRPVRSKQVGSQEAPSSHKVEPLSVIALRQKDDGPVPPKDGDYVLAFDPEKVEWHVRFRYADRADAVLDWTLPRYEGFYYIAQMLVQANRDVPCSGLVLKAEPVSGGSVVSDTELEESFDDDGNGDGNSDAQSDKAIADEGKADIRRNLKHLKRDLQLAVENRDIGLQKKLTTDISLIEKFRRISLGLGGKSRTLDGGDIPKRIKDNIRNRISDAKKYLLVCAGRASNTNREGLKAFSNHLEAIKVRGKSCTYLCDTKIIWEIRLP